MFDYVDKFILHSDMYIFVRMHPSFIVCVLRELELLMHNLLTAAYIHTTPYRNHIIWLAS